jgi:hypothetical protein
VPLVLSCRSVPVPVTEPPPDLLSEINGLLEQFPDTKAEMLARHYNETITVADHRRYIVIKRAVDYYTGGAHGIRRTDYQVFDRDSARFVRLSDIVDGSKLPALHGVVVAELKKKFNLREDQQLTDAGFFQNDFPLTENFFLSENGIGFHWNLYELAPYVFGEIEVIVPWE